MQKEASNSFIHWLRNSLSQEFKKPVTGKQYQMLTKNSYMWMSSAAGTNNTGLLKETGAGLEAGKLYSS